jgi:iron complex outermembrane recepter protein
LKPRADANQYAISARGFNNVLANRMLVLMDGRTLYTPLFSGVFWEAQEVVLHDVERIEVITGPSTALWGANAVNGLVHIITRSARDTQGAAAALHAGNRGHGGSVRGGFALGPTPSHGHLRLYAQAYDREGTRLTNRTPVNDDADGSFVGARADWDLGRTRVSMQAEGWRGTIDPPATARTYSGAHLNLNAEHDTAAGGRFALRGVLERTHRVQGDGFADDLDVVDLVAEHRFAPWASHTVTLGGGIRQAFDRSTPSAGFAFVPNDRRLRTWRAFAQEQWSPDDRFTLTASASLEHNPYTGTETLPAIRASWSARPGQLLWGSLARAVRAPSRVDRELFRPAQPPYLLAGGPDFRSEVSDVAELGWRGQPADTLSASLTVHAARHRDLRSLAPTPLGLQFRNDIEGRSHGLELWAKWRATPRWQLDGALVLLRERLAVKAGQVDVGGLAALGNSPRRHASLRSSVELSPRWRWDLDLRHMGALPNPAVPSYTAVDTRLVWAPANGHELMVGVHNAADPRHPEWGAATNRAEIERGAFVMWRLWP